MAESILGEADVDFYLASKGYKVSNLHNSSRHNGKIIEWNIILGGRN